MVRRDFLLKGGQAAFVSCFAAPEILANRSQLIEELEKLIPELMKEAVLPGLSIALVKNGKLFWRRAFGVKDSDSKEPLTNESVFEAASVSKTVFAYAVMKLCENGILGLDIPLSKYTEELFLENDPRLKLITARHVLSHSTGFQNVRSGDEPLKIHFNPGQQFSYSGEGYFYLQSVMSHLTGNKNPADCAQYEADLPVCATDFDDYMQKHLLRPFGMNHSGYVWNDKLARQSTRPHDVNGKPFAKSMPNAKDTARYGAMGGLHTTASDYAKFLIEVIDPKKSDAFHLDKKSLSEMLRPQIELNKGEEIDGAGTWALGWAVQQRKTGNIILHSGGQAGFRSLAMASIERKSGFVMLTNGDNGGKVILDQKLGKMLDQLLVG